jgi:putative DNA primase/helicase
MFPLEGPEPRPLPPDLPSVLPCREDLLPDQLRPWLVDTARRMQCAIDYPAMATIVVLSSLVAKSVRIRPKAHDDDWVVIPNLWGLGVGSPSQFKSPALEEALRLVYSIQRELTSEWRALHGKWKGEQKRAVLVEKINEERAAAMLADDMATDTSSILISTLGDEPRHRRLIVNDASSTASLVKVLESNLEGILVYRDEFSSVLKLLEKDLEQRAFYLQGYDGNKSYERIRTHGAVYIDRVCISALGGIQPGRLQKYVRASVEGREGDDGLLQRFSLTVWPDMSTSFENIDRPANADARDRAFTVYKRLANLPMGTEEDCCLRFDASAQARFDEWRTEFETRLRAEQMHPAVQSHLGKYRKLLPALALLFEAINSPHPRAVGLASFELALCWVEYLETHARRVYWPVADTSAVVAAKALLDALRRGKVAKTFSQREVYVNDWKDLKLPDVKKAVALLVRYGWLRHEVFHTKGRPGEVFTAHPAVFRMSA